MQLLANAPRKGPTELAGRIPLSGLFPRVTAPEKLSAGRSQQLLELACKVARAALGAIGVASAEGNLVEFISFGLSEEAAREVRRSAWLSDLVQAILRQSGALAGADLGLAFPRLSNPAGLPALGPFLAQPLNCPGRYRVAMYLARRSGQPEFTPAEKEAIEPIRTFLEQGSVYEEAHLLSQLRLMNRLARTASGHLELGQLLERSLRELDRYFPLHVSVVWLVDSSTARSLSLAAAGSIPTSRAAALGLRTGLQLPVDQTPFAQCLVGGEGLYLDLAQPETGAANERLSPLDQNLAGKGVTCSFAAPLRAGDQAVGVLQSVCTQAAGFSGEQIQLLYLVADLLGPAISNCRLFDRLSTTCEELRSAQDQLIQSEKMRALGELASGMAHDFNNSLCGVLGFLELTLADRSLAVGVRNYLDSARTCALDAAHTVRQVQDFARCRTRQPVRQLVNVNDLLHQTVELTRHKWDNPTRAPNIPIAVTVNAEPATLVSGNPAELREVLTNLVFNAVDAMPGGGTLTLQSWSTPTEVFIGVTDTGVGMPPAVRQRIFEPFFTTKGDRGTGLGLSVAFGIIQAHGGEIIVSSEEAKGTTLTIRLPIPKGEIAKEEPNPTNGQAAAKPAIPPSSPQDPQSRQPGTAHGTDAPVSRRLQVLAVEDEPSVRAFLERVLSHLGHQPHVTADAPEALAAFAEKSFDLVITDLGLPGMTGEDLARNIAAQSPATPIVLLTGWADQLLVEGKPLAGVTRILGKPLTMAALADTLDALCPRA
jgi:signal transduction histidine kinase/CheY-like chemotaxis protein